MNEDMMYLNITRESSSDYRFVLAHPDAVMVAQAVGCERSIAACIRKAFREVAVGESVSASLLMVPDSEEYPEADMPRPRRGDGILVKGGDSPDYEKAACFLMSRMSA